MYYVKKKTGEKGREQEKERKAKARNSRKHELKKVCVCVFMYKGNIMGLIFNKVQGENLKIKSFTSLNDKFM